MIVKLASVAASALIGGGSFLAVHPAPVHFDHKVHTGCETVAIETTPIRAGHPSDYQVTFCGQHVPDISLSCSRTSDSAALNPGEVVKKCVVVKR